MFSKILIANRGEIAVRVIRACREMGIATVAVCSESDRGALHTSLADECICIGPDPASGSYLNMEAIVSTAKLTGAQAIHPGYGLLSENAEFADLCVREGLVFIGPDGSAIARMGDKNEARRLMKAAGVPLVPGSEALDSAKQAAAEAQKIGYPVLLKAKAGGGGRGIRLVRSAKEMDLAFATATEEAERAFSDGGLYLEKHLSKVKHIEIQILADEQGNIVCLGERECSVQRGNQKLIEEAPAPTLSPKLRRAMSKAAINAAAAAGYVNAGTVEFLLDKDGSFYFMEMNTRLQVEHPVTEMISGIDIVKWQIRIAAGVPLKFKQNEVLLRGASIECRINARACGQVELLHVPGGPWVRFDSGLYAGAKILPYYDPMIGKLIVHGGTRAEAIRKMKSAICELIIEGVPTNIDEQLAILNEPDFVEGSYCTDLISGGISGGKGGL